MERQETKTNELKEGQLVTQAELEKICLELNLQKVIERNCVVMYEGLTNIYVIDKINEESKYKIERIYRK